MEKGIFYLKKITIALVLVDHAKFIETISNPEHVIACAETDRKYDRDFKIRVFSINFVEGTFTGEQLDPLNNKNLIPIEGIYKKVESRIRKPYTKQPASFSFKIFFWTKEVQSTDLKRSVTMDDGISKKEEKVFA